MGLASSYRTIMHLTRKKKVKLPAVGFMILPGTLVLELLLRVVADLRAHMIWSKEQLLQLVLFRPGLA